MDCQTERCPHGPRAGRHSPGSGWDSSPKPALMPQKHRQAQSPHACAWRSCESVGDWSLHPPTHCQASLLTSAGLGTSPRTAGRSLVLPSLLAEHSRPQVQPQSRQAPTRTQGTAGAEHAQLSKLSSCPDRRGFKSEESGQAASAARGRVESPVPGADSAAGGGACWAAARGRPVTNA